MPSIVEEEEIDNHYQLVDMAVLDFSDLTKQKFQDIQHMFGQQKKAIN